MESDGKRRQKKKGRADSLLYKLRRWQEEDTPRKKKKEIFVMVLKSICFCAEGTDMSGFFTTYMVPPQEMRTINSYSTHLCLCLSLVMSCLG